MAVAVLRKENSERKKMNKELLKIKFHPSRDRVRVSIVSVLQWIAEKIEPTLLIGGIVEWYDAFEKNIPTDKENVVFHLHDKQRKFSSSAECNLAKRHKSFRYKLSERPSSYIRCWNIEELRKMKTFTTQLDLYELMNEDLCNIAKQNK